MSILIKGMKMPEKGKYIDIIIFDSGKVVYYEDGQEFGEAVELPDHGDLIDKDSLVKMCDAPHWCVWLSEIEDAPIVIPAERKEG